MYRYARQYIHALGVDVTHISSFLLRMITPSITLFTHRWAVHHPSDFWRLEFRSSAYNTVEQNIVSSDFAICSRNMADDNEAGLLAVAETTGLFASQFLKAVASDNPGNLIASPLSAQVVLAMAAYGANSTTAEQMRSVLHIPENDELAQIGYQSLIETLNAQKGVDLRLANKIYTSIACAVKSSFKELTGTKFLSTSEELDFNDAAGAAQTINAWCEDKTNNRIKDLVSSDSIGSDTMLVLVNAVYFKGSWENKFDPSLTEDRPFHVDGTATEDVPTMYIEQSLRFGDLPDLSARFIEIPYEGGDLSMVIVLPNEIDGLQTVLDNFENVNLGESLQVFPRKAELYLPKFKIESTLDLNTILANMGMKDMFEDQADFSGMADLPLKVSKVIQKAFIEVNEEGSEAAAATAVTMMLRCAFPVPVQPEVFRVDRPFYYSIYQNSSRIPLFTGLVHRPIV